MPTLNHVLSQSLLAADGRYLSTQELAPLDRYAQSYAVRLHVYEQLRDQSAAFVLQALRQLAQLYPELVQQHGRRCQYDMTAVLRYMALSVWRDDERFFKEQMLTWLQTMLLAHKRTTHCARAYQCLQTVIAAALPAADVALTRPYFDLITHTLETHA